jgi:hypothetical protein
MVLTRKIRVAWNTEALWTKKELNNVLHLREIKLKII